MSHPEQGRPADQAADDPRQEAPGRTSPVPGRDAPDEHQRPGGYDEDPRQDPGPHQGAPYGARPDEQPGGGSGAAPGQQYGQQYGQQPGPQPGPPHGDPYGAQPGGRPAGPVGGGRAGHDDPSVPAQGAPPGTEATGRYTDRHGEPSGPPTGQEFGAATGQQPYGAVPGQAGGAGPGAVVPDQQQHGADAGMGGAPGAYPGPPDHGHGAPGEPTGGRGAPGEPVRGQGDRSGGGDADEARGTIIDPHRAAHWRSQWEEVRMMFVDRPQDAASRADGLVGEVLEELSRTFSHQRSALDPAALGGEPSTEELRRAVQRYREFFDRLLTL